MNNNFLNEALESASRRIDVALKAASAELAFIRANVLERVAAAHQYLVEGKSIGVRYTDFPEFQNHGFYKGRA